jgi:purine-binding chemotaxis protein CheW
VETTTVETRQYVTFVLMGEEYGVEIPRVREIIEYEPITRIPTMPALVRGVMNLRGSVVPVVDLALKFGQPETPAGKETYIVVFDLVWNDESVRLELMIRALGRVIDAADELVKPVPDFGTRIRADYLRGIVGVDGQFVLLLNVDRLLSPAELVGTISARDEAVGGGAQLQSGSSG